MEHNGEKRSTTQHLLSPASILERSTIDSGEESDDEVSSSTSTRSPARSRRRARCGRQRRSRSKRSREGAVSPAGSSATGMQLPVERPTTDDVGTDLASGGAWRGWSVPTTPEALTSTTPASSSQPLIAVEPALSSSEEEECAMDASAVVIDLDDLGNMSDDEGGSEAEPTIASDDECIGEIVAPASPYSEASEAATIVLDDSDAPTTANNDDTHDMHASLLLDAELEHMKNLMGDTGEGNFDDEDHQTELSAYPLDPIGEESTPACTSNDEELDAPPDDTSGAESTSTTALLDEEAVEFRAVERELTSHMKNRVADMVDLFETDADSLNADKQKASIAADKPRTLTVEQFVAADTARNGDEVEQTPSSQIVTNGTSGAPVSVSRPESPVAEVKRAKREAIEKSISSASSSNSSCLYAVFGVTAIVAVGLFFVFRRQRMR